jgi:autotransporter-associated beta strand protein
VNLGAASLQISNDQTTTTGTISLNGGSVEGFLARDSQIARANVAQGAVTRTLGAGVSLKLLGDSFLGQNNTAGVNGLESGVSPTFGAPYVSALTGSPLDIRGVIFGAGSLTKQGFDTVTLSGANTYTGGTNVNAGVLRIGADNALRPRQTD